MEIKKRKKEWHGLSATRFHHRWRDMLNRIHNPKCISYGNYGGRGITMSKAWTKSFLAFKKDMYASYLRHKAKYGERNTQIERRNTNGGYYKSNCFWTTAKAQSNNKRNTVMVSFKSKTKTLSDWSEMYKVPGNIINSRLSKGWDVEKAIKTPVKSRNVNTKTNTA